jgi:predicted RNA-binding Zn-ribbon protein involved in translation (DUF1610 family)
MLLENIFCETCGGRVELNDTGATAKCIICGNVYLVKYSETRETANGFTSDGKGCLKTYFARETSVVIPDEIDGVAVKTIGDNLFHRRGLISVSIPKGISTIGDGAFFENKLTTIVIPPSVTSIGNGAFRDNKLTSLSIPPSVTHIGEDAFRYNPLTKIIIGADVILGKIYDDECYRCAFDDDFDDFYNANGKKAGTYTYDDGQWTFLKLTS